MKKKIFIAEIKTKSPYGFQSPHSFIKLMETAIEYGDWISVHDNALWGGDSETISFVRQNTNKPILAKGIHYTNERIIEAIDAGADYVLSAGRVAGSAEDIGERQKVKLRNSDYKKIIYELDYEKVLSLVNFSSYWKESKYVCNSRDLSTGKFKEKNEIEDFVKLGTWVCQASGIKSKNDVNSNVDAFIVGENLLEFCKNI